MIRRREFVTLLGGASTGGFDGGTRATLIAAGYRLYRRRNGKRSQPYTAEFRLGFSELGFLEGLVKGGAKRGAALRTKTGRSRWCRGKRGAALLVAGFSPRNAASAQHLI